MRKKRVYFLILVIIVVIAIGLSIEFHSEYANFDEFLNCADYQFFTPTIVDYGGDFIVLQSLKQQKILVGEFHEFEQIILGPPLKMEVGLLSKDHRSNYLVIKEDNYMSLSEFEERRHVKSYCKQLIDNPPVEQISPLDNLSSLFAPLDSPRWVISDALEMSSNHEHFRSNAIHHYTIFIKGHYVADKINSVGFDANIDLLNFESLMDSQNYYLTQSNILERNALGRETLAVDVESSEHQIFCYGNSLSLPQQGCIFIGRLGDIVLEVMLFPNSDSAKMELPQESWLEFVEAIWQSVFSNYSL